jgi:putative photosynthetic complex assembly protein 2
LRQNGQNFQQAAALCRLGEASLMTRVWDIAGPAIFVVFVWYASTGVIFYANGRAETTYRWSLLAAAAIASVLVGAVATVGDGSAPGDAVLGFLTAIAVWGLVEMSFLMGVITGPRQTDCPPGCRGWQRFVYAFQVIAYHEVALLMGLAVLVASGSGPANTVAVWTFALLWLMRLSTKFNLFLGVPNTSVDLLPQRIAHIKSYFRQAPMNVVFPLSITLATLAVFGLGLRTVDATASRFDVTAFSMLTTLAVLGLIEHWFLVVPLQIEKLWAWSLDGGLVRPQSAKSQAAEPVQVIAFPHKRRSPPGIAAAATGLAVDD